VIKTLNHAIDVQIVRVDNGKRGYAHAVRRFMKRSSGDWYGYNELKQQLPANQINPEPIEDNSNGTLQPS